MVNQAPAELADVIIELISNPRLAHSMGAAGQRKVIERYTWQHLSMLTERAYEEVLS